MSTNEPQWSADEQAMVDMMEIAGCAVVLDANNDCCFVHVHRPDAPLPNIHMADTQYEVIRKAFTAWGKNREVTHA